MKFSPTNIISFLVITVFFSNCRDAYKFQLIKSEAQLVVNGGINSGPAPYYLSLGSTGFPGQIPTPMDHALITISDNHGNSEAYIPSGKGQYLLNGKNVKGVPGTKYQLSIALQDGRTYHSTQESMPFSPPTVDTTFYKITQEDVVSSEGVTLLIHFAAFTSTLIFQSTQRGTSDGQCRKSIIVMSSHPPVLQTFSSLRQATITQTI